MRPGQSDAETVRLAKVLVPVIAVIGAYFAISGSSTIVALLLMGYSFVTQLFPALVCSLLKRNPVTAPGAFAGICVGVGTVIYFTLETQTIGKLAPGAPEFVRDLNIGTVALLLNFVVMVAVSAATARALAAAGRAAE